MLPEFLRSSIFLLVRLKAAVVLGKKTDGSHAAVVVPRQRQVAGTTLRPIPDATTRVRRQVARAGLCRRRGNGRETTEAKTTIVRDLVRARDTLTVWQLGARSPRQRPAVDQPGRCPVLGTTYIYYPLRTDTLRPSVV